MIPDGWKMSSLGEVSAKIHQGINIAAEKVEYSEVGVPILRAKDMTSGVLNFKDTRFLSQQDYALYENKYQPVPGQILFSNRGTIGKPYLVSQVNKFLIEWNILVIEPLNTNDSGFIYLSLAYLDDKKYFESLSTGNATQFINLSTLRKTPILLPPLLEQCKIAEVLGVWDESIDLLERLIGKTRSRKQGLMQQLLTGKKRFKEFEGSEYSIVKLSEVAKIRRGASPRPIQDPKWFAEKGRGWVRIRDVTASNTYLMETTQYLSNLAVEKSVKVDPGDLIMSICATIGVPRIVGIPACIHDGFVVLREFEKYIDKFFLYHYINLISAKISDSGQPGTQKNINTTIVGNIEVPKFSIPEQEKIAAVLSAADEEISTLEKQLAAYKQQKLGLMQQLLTGRIRI